MKQTKIIMGMPVAVEIVGVDDSKIFQKIFDYFAHIDKKFSTFKKNSEISKINQGKVKPEESSFEMKEVLKLSELTKRQTNNYFDIKKDNYIDPSGLVKGWAINNASNLLTKDGYKNFYIDAGGDIQAIGKNSKDKAWSVGIRNPFDTSQIIKVLHLSDRAVATSGTYERGDHIYNPKQKDCESNIISLTVIGQNIYDADRFATAAFAMGEAGITFIENLKNFEGYMVNKKRVATQTSGFGKYTIES